MALLGVQLKKETGNGVRGESDMQQMVPGPGVEPGSAAARMKPLHMGRCSIN